MKILIDQKHKEFFSHRRWIEFEDIFSSEEMDTFKEAAKSLIDPKSPFASGRNLWGRSEVVKKLIGNRLLVQIATGLSEKKPLRLAFDQYLTPGFGWEGKGSFNDVCSIKNVAIFFLISLDERNGAEEFPTPFSSHKGNVVCLTPHKLIDFTDLHEQKGEYFLIAYAGAKGQYYLNERDPATRAWIEMGYSPGDRLNDKDHPIICR